MSLYTIALEEKELLDKYTDQETGEIMPEYFVIIEELENKMTDKADNIGKYIRSLEVENKSIDDEIERLEKRKTGNTKKLEGMKKYIEAVMDQFHYSKLDGLLFSFSFRNSKRTEIIDKDKIPGFLKTYSVSLRDLNKIEVEELKSANVCQIEEVEVINKTELKKWFETLSEEEQEKYSDAVQIKECRNLTIK